MKKIPKRNFWYDGLSIDESRVSVLIVLLIISFGYAGYTLISIGDIPASLVQITLGLITAVAGVNIADSFANRRYSSTYYSDPVIERPLDNDQVPPI